MIRTTPVLPTAPVHLVLGYSAAVCLQAACDACGMPGTVTRFGGELAHGPLGATCPLVLQMRALTKPLDQSRHDALVVWVSDNVEDTIFMAIASEQSNERPESFCRVRVPALDLRPFVAMHSPAQLAQLYATCESVSATELQSMAQDLERIRDTCGPLRRLEQGHVVGAPIDFYDPLLLDACGPDWQTKGRVMALAMARCDGPNLMSDGFFAARLGHLVDAGHIDANAMGTLLRKSLLAGR